jgi:hypothetical protein
VTEQEWLASDDPDEMVRALGSRVGTRRVQLYAAACCRRVWHLLADDRSRSAIAVLEQFADGQAAVAALETAAMAAEDAAEFSSWSSNASAPAHSAAVAVRWALDRAAVSAATCARSAVAPIPVPYEPRAYKAAQRAEAAKQIALLRCIFGNPFAPSRPITAAWLRWNGCTVVRIAQGIYEERAFERMGVLADALLDAGCDNEDILQHCHEQGAVHARGCWVLDLLLGK